MFRRTLIAAIAGFVFVWNTTVSAQNGSALNCHAKPNPGDPYMSTGVVVDFEKAIVWRNGIAYPANINDQMIHWKEPNDQGAITEFQIDRLTALWFVKTQIRTYHGECVPAEKRLF